MSKVYNFDEQISRLQTGSLKWDALEERYGRSDLLSMWVADMDFATPDFVVEAMQKRLEHPIFGYTQLPKAYWPSVIAWIKQQHQWDISAEWLSYIPGIVRGIGMAINVFVKPHEKVIIQPPVYHPFRLTPEGNKREVVYNPLIHHEDGTYSMDFEQLEQVADANCRMLILSNPHNPAGIVWDKQTLTRLAEFCHKRHIIVISDEIHADMALWNNKHIPFASVSEEAAACSITFGAPSKTFNIAGLISSYAIVPNKDIREPFFSWMEVNELNQPHLFAPVATIAAYQQGNPWRQQMLSYIEKNIDLVMDFCAEHIPQIKPLRPQASFLVWLDCRDLGLSQTELESLFVEKAHLALNNGEMFGKEGIGFMRMNVGTTRATLLEALTRLKNAIK